MKEKLQTIALILTSVQDQSTLQLRKENSAPPFSQSLQSNQLFFITKDAIQNTFLSKRTALGQEIIAKCNIWMKKNGNAQGHGLLGSLNRPSALFNTNRKYDIILHYSNSYNNN